MTWLDKNFKVDSKTGTEHIRVTVEGDNDHELLDHFMKVLIETEYLQHSLTVITCETIA